MGLLWAMIVQSVTVWSPPAQAAWADAAPVIDVRVHSENMSMQGDAATDIEIVSGDEGLAVSPFLQVTRGIAFRIESTTGEQMRPLEPIMISPPPPPVARERLVAITRSRPFRVRTHQPAHNLFPGPGTYRLSAVVFLLDTFSTPARRLRAASKPVTVRVTP